MQEQNKCKICGKLCYKTSTWCLRCAKLGVNNPQYGLQRKRRRKTSYGYIYVYKPKHPFCTKQGYIMEHRLIMEQKIKRYLKPKEKVHHINGIKDDNRIENLQLFSGVGEHIKYHVSKYHRDTNGKFKNGKQRRKN